MSAKHTPGPWVVDEGTDRADNMADCLLHPHSAPWVAVGINDTDGYAESVAYCHPDNAPLIAAAPELLAVVERIEAQGLGDFQLIQAARAATAKARGEA